MNRRGFIGSIIAAASAPAIVRADSLMRVVPMDRGIITPGPWEFHTYHSAQWLHLGGGHAVDSHELRFEWSTAAGVFLLHNGRQDEPAWALVPPTWTDPREGQ